MTLPHESTFALDVPGPSGTRTKPLVHRAARTDVASHHAGARDVRDRFVGAQILREQVHSLKTVAMITVVMFASAVQERPGAFGQPRPKAFDASQYGFFGRMDDVHGALGGALEVSVRLQALPSRCG
jgi:hypothetical protein